MLITLIFYFAALAVADDCTTVDLSGSFKQTVNQGNLSWCYAYTAADMISQKLQKTGDLKSGEQISHIQVASLVHLSSGEMPIMEKDTRMHVRSALDSVTKITQRSPNIKLCKTSDFKGSLEGDEHALFKTTSSKMDKYVIDHGLRDPALCESGQKLTMKIIKLSRDMKRFTEEVWLQEYVHKCKISTPPLATTQALSQNRCGERYNTHGFPKNDEKDALIKSNIDAALDNKSIPGITYNLDLFDAEKGRGLHASTIVKRARSPDGNCRYLIRNSWGKGCDSYEDKKSCVGGNIWVTREKLLAHTCQAEYIP